jgi:hypothetical protein
MSEAAKRLAPALGAVDERGGHLQAASRLLLLLALQHGRVLGRAKGEHVWRKAVEIVGDVVNVNRQTDNRCYGTVTL